MTAAPHMAEELLGCPFCGGEAWLNDYEAKHGDMTPASRCPQCKSCGCSLGYLPTAAKAISAWNRRAPDEKDAEIARLPDVKALEWRPVSTGVAADAFGVAGFYRILGSPGCWVLQYPDGNLTRIEESDHQVPAKHHAEVSHKARVLAALSPT